MVSRMLRAAAAFLLLTFLPALAQDGHDFRIVRDATTGIKIGLPFDLLTAERPIPLGRNWSSRDRSFNVDLLAFPDGQQLRAVYDKLRSVKGRVLTRSFFSETKFVLEGRDAGGSGFYIIVRQEQGALRGFSMVFAQKRKAALSELIARIVQSFDPFPADAAAEEPAGASGNAEVERRDGPASIDPNAAPAIAVVPNVGLIDPNEEAVLSPDGRILATHNEYRVKLWDVATGRLLRTLQYKVFFQGVAFLKGGALLASAHKDGSIKLWDVASGANTQTLQTVDADGYRGLTAAMAVNNERGWLSDGVAGKLAIWDFERARKIGSFSLGDDTTWIAATRISADGSKFLAATENELKVFDIHSGRVINSITLPPGHRFNHDSLIGDNEFIVLENGRWVSDSKCDLATVKLLHLSAPANLDTVDAPAVCKAPENDYEFGTPKIFFDARKHRLLVVRRHMPGLKFWNLQTRAVERTLNWPHDSTGDIMALSDDMSMAVTNENGIIRLRQSESGDLVQEFLSYGDFATKRIVASADNQQILFAESPQWENEKTEASEASLLRWRVGEVGPKKPVILKGAYSVLDVSPDGASALASKENTLIELSLTDGHELHRFALPLATISFARFSPDGSFALVFGSDAEKKDKNLLLDTKSGQVRLDLIAYAHSSDDPGMSAVAISADGRQAAAGYWDGSVTVWKTQTGKLQTSFIYKDREDLDDPVFSLAFSKDGKFLFGGHRDIGVTMWGLAPARVIRTFELDVIAGHVNTASVAVSRDGKTVIAGLAERARSSGDIGAERAIRVWDVATGKLLHNLVGHELGVGFVSFSGDDRQIISASYDGTIRYWDRETGKLIALTTSAQGGRWLTITDNGFFAASENAAGDMISVVRGLETYSVMQFYEPLARGDLVLERLRGDPEAKYAKASHELNLKKILESGSAPEIELLPQKTEKASDSVRVTVRVKDTGGGIGAKIVFRVNGEPRARFPDGLGGPPSIGRAVTVTETLKIDPSHPNIVDVTAYNGAGLLATTPSRMTIDSYGAAEGEHPRLYVLAIGVGKAYAMEKYRLDFPELDAELIVTAFQRVGEGLFTEVKTQSLIGAQANEREIAAAFDRLSNEVRANDVFILFLAGHGSSPDGRYYFVPQNFNTAAGDIWDRNWIGLDKWEKWITKVEAGKSLIIMDTCESAAARSLIRGDDMERETAMDQLQHAAGHNLIAAADRAAREVEGLRHGLLTYTVLQALAGEGISASDDRVTVSEIADHVLAEVPVISQRIWQERQQPYRKLEGGDFPVGKRDPSLKPDHPICMGKHYVVLRDEQARQEAQRDAVVNRSVDAGTEVIVTEFANSWARVCKNSIELGYVPADAVKELH